MFLRPAEKIVFDPPRQERVDLLVIAGEHSGDEHAARMVAASLQRDPSLRIAAVGGAKLEEAGAQLLFNFLPYATIGFIEPLRHLKTFFAIRDEIVRWIELYQPRAVCFVDYPGFNLRLAKALSEKGLSAKAGGPTKLLYYISPQVWAWKKKRKYAMAELLDAMAVIFPFEVDFFGDTDLPVQFVGHPFLSSGYALPVQYDPDGPILLLPGSRHSAVERIAPCMLDAFHECLKRRYTRRAVCIYATDSLRRRLEEMIAQRPGLAGHIDLVPNSSVVGAAATLASSGTMSLNCCLANIPGAMVYRMHPLTYLLGKFLVKLDYVGIANLLLGRAMYPEFLQGAASDKRLSKELIDCLEDVERIKATRHDAAALRELLDKPANGGVGKWIVEQLEG